LVLLVSQITLHLLETDATLELPNLLPQKIVAVKQPVEGTVLGLQLLGVPSRLLVPLFVHLLDLAHEACNLVTQLKTFLSKGVFESVISLVFLLELGLESGVEELADSGRLAHVELLLLALVVCVVAFVFHDLELLM
jgi:hypothetical protein